MNIKKKLKNNLESLKQESISNLNQSISTISKGAFSYIWKNTEKTTNGCENK